MTTRMNTSWLLASLLLMLGGTCSTTMAQNLAAEFSSYRGNDRYDFRITHEELARTPVWREDDPNPPLPARQARLIAIDYLGKLFADADKWKLNEITLHPVADRWVYSIAFTEPPRLGCVDCLSSPFSVVVTMDGKAVPASISPWKR